MAEKTTQDDRPDVAALHRALFEQALPLWRERGWDERHGGFHDRLDSALDPVALPAKRLLVQCRQLFVYSHASVIAPEQGWADIAHRLYAVLTEQYRDAAHGGWFFSVAPTGLPHDRRKDTYGHAFVLFALAHYGRIFRSDAALAHAAQTLDLLETRLAAANGGFAEAAADDWRVIAMDRRQNPHMHLLEAFLALYETTGDERYARQARAMLRLFETVFTDPATATLGEFFGADWRVHPTKGDIVEPGHHFEWYWLARRAAVLLGTAPLDLAEALFAWADRHGVDAEHGGVFDQLHRNGSIVTASKRLWPLAEAIRAYAVAVRAREPGDAHDRARAASLTSHLLHHYADARCGFREHLDRSGGVIVGEVFASSLYHVFGAYLELAGR